MFMYLAPVVTALLAFLGIFFSKDGTSNRLTRIGYLILALTAVSGGVALFDANYKQASSDQQNSFIGRLQDDVTKANSTIGRLLDDVTKANSTIGRLQDDVTKANNIIGQLQGDVTRAGNLNIASLFGINRKFRFVHFWMVTPTFSDEARQERERYLSRKLRDDEFIPEVITDDFIGGFMSKRDLSHTITIDGEYLDYSFGFILKSKTADVFTVEQNIDGNARSYECNEHCGASGPTPKSATDLGKRNLIAVERETTMNNFGFDVWDGSSVGKVVSGLQAVDRPFIRLKSTFTNPDEYKKFQRVIETTAFSFKLHGEGRTRPTNECSLAVAVPVTGSIKHDASRMETSVLLSSIQSMKIDLCETPP